MIEQLPILTPDAARSERTRMACRKRLERRRRRLERQADANHTGFAAERAVLAGFCVVFMVSVVSNVVRVMLGG